MKFLVAITALVVVYTTEAHAFKLGNMIIPQRRAHTDSFVAFSAGLTHNADVAANASISFDKVWTNAGNGYNNVTGQFTCPHSGTYVFIYHGLTETSGTLWLDLYKNDQYQITGYAHNVNDYAAASNAMVLQLDENDIVYVKGHGTSTLYGRGDEVYATFSGFLLADQSGQ